MTVARDIMTENPEFVFHDDDLGLVAKRLRDLNVGSLPVCENGKLVGVVTDRDIVTKVLAEGRNPSLVRADELTQGEAVTIGADDDAREILRTMTSHQVRRLPVIDGHQLVGIVALADVAQNLPDAQVGELVEALSSESPIRGKAEAFIDKLKDTVHDATER
jgi:CBS domain-containing protein